MKYITRTVWILSLISLCTDAASEMLYPVMPLYLKSIGFSIVALGVLEGFAEALAGLSKMYFGRLSDHRHERVPFVRLGYALSSLAKPMTIFFVAPIWIFFCRSVDRLGKGIRSGARDALLSDESSLDTKARVFGFHRSMDTMGAVIGPSIALLYLFFFPERYTSLFLIAFVPGILAVVLSFYLNEKKEKNETDKISYNFISLFAYWNKSNVAYKKILIGFLFFALFNSSDIFLILQTKQMGFNDIQVLGFYIFYNLMYALMAFPMGVLADRIGLRFIFSIGLLAFAFVYFGMATTVNFYFCIVFYFLYAIYAAATEGISKAWISKIVNKDETATAIGMYAGLQSLATLFASSITGLIWWQYGSTIALLLSGIIAFLVAIYFLTMKTA